MTKAELPAFFRSADRHAEVWQARFKGLQLVQFLLLLGVAVGGATTWKQGDVEVSAWISATALVVALAVRLAQTQLRPEHRWYDGRAAAESAKTLSWRYAVRARPFGPELADDEADRLFVERLHDLSGLLTDLTEPSGAASQITERMRELRDSPLAERIDAYRAGRIEQQLQWYTDRANRHRRRALGWAITVIVLEAAALFAVLLRLTTDVEFDWLGILATASAGAVGWLQTQQHENLARAYSIASHELGLIRDLIHTGIDQTEWNDLVDKAEDAISREHRLWLAAR